jgi:hypothetical protein
MERDITTGVQTITAAGVLTGTLDTSALTDLGTLKLAVTGLTAGAAARIVVEDTANSSAFSDALAVHVFDIAGQVNVEQDLSVKMQDKPTLRFGASNTKLRANCTVLNGSSPSLSAHVWLEQ